MSDKPNLTDARRVTDAATKGVWINTPQTDDSVYIVAACDHIGCHDYPMEHPDVLRIKDDEVLYGLSQDDAEFIAASRALVPALLAAVDAVLAVHECVGVYSLIDECGHHHEEDDERIGSDEYGDAFCLDSPTGDRVCAICRIEDGDMEPWPCLTVRSIAAHLDIEPR